MAFAASVKPFGTSTKALAVKRATNGMAQMLNGIMAAVVPSVVFKMKRVKGNKMINKIMKGMERPMLITIFKMRFKRAFCRISPLPVRKVSTPKGKPTITARRVEAKLIYTVS